MKAGLSDQAGGKRAVACGRSPHTDWAKLGARDGDNAEVAEHLAGGASLPGERDPTRCAEVSDARNRIPSIRAGIRQHPSLHASGTFAAHRQAGTCSLVWERARPHATPVASEAASTQVVMLVIESICTR
jgi:hypothetical protein